MKWRSWKSPLKRWIERNRQSSYSGSSQMVLPLFPRKIGYGNGAPVYWLSPVLRTRKSTSWKSRSCFDPGYSSWWSYSEPYDSSKAWGEWVRTRPVHHLAGLIYFLVYWSWYPALIVGFFWFMAGFPGLSE